MGRRAGERIRQAARAERRRRLRVHWWRIALIAGVFVMLMVPIVLMQPSSTVKAYFAGAITVAAAWLITIGIQSSDGAAHLWRGAEGEEFTSDELRKLRQHGRWYVIDSVLFDGFDVDHVAVGPGGIYAVESKNYGADIELTRPPDWLTSVSRQAHLGARKIRGLLSRYRRFDVTPVVVLWGARVGNVPGGTIWIDEVLYCVGRQSRLWRAAFDQDTLEPGEVELAREAIQQFVLAREDYDRKAQALQHHG